MDFQRFHLFKMFLRVCLYMDHLHAGARRGSTGPELELPEESQELTLDPLGEH